MGKFCAAGSRAVALVETGKWWVLSALLSKSDEIILTHSLTPANVVTFLLAFLFSHFRNIKL